MIFMSRKTADAKYNKEICNKIGLLMYEDFLSKDKYNTVKNYITNHIKYKGYYPRKYMYYGYDFVYNKVSLKNVNLSDPIPYELEILNMDDLGINQLNIDIIEKYRGFTPVINRPFFNEAVFIFNVGSPLYITFENIATGKEYTVMVDDNTLIALSTMFRDKYKYYMYPRKYFYFNNRKDVRHGISYMLTYRSLNENDLLE